MKTSPADMRSIPSEYDPVGVSSDRNSGLNTLPAMNLRKHIAARASCCLHSNHFAICHCMLVSILDRGVYL